MAETLQQIGYTLTLYVTVPILIIWGIVLVCKAIKRGGE